MADNTVPFIERMINIFQTSPKIQLFVVVVFALVALGLIIGFGIQLGSTLNPLATPTIPKGWADHDYDGEQNTRASLTDLINSGSSSITMDTPMVQLSVATANYGGILTEKFGTADALLNPWLGRVDSEVVRLQIEAGARAVIFDIWPDPANPAIPVVCSMKDTNEWSSISWWRDHGLSKGIGQYSNWQLTTRNKVPASDMISMACTTAFGAMAPNVQTGDPFFLILRLHGAMTINYLNYLGDTIKAALGSHRMETQWDSMNNQGNLCSAKVSEFMGRGFVIVSPDIQPGYNSLPGINTWDTFRTKFLTSRLAEVTNVLESAPNTVFFGLGNLDAIATATLSPCTTGGSPMTPAQAGFCVIQPTIGGKTTTNDKQIGPERYTKARQVGTQFVAVNYFSPDTSEKIMGTVLSPGLFGKYSFKMGA